MRLARFLTTTSATPQLGGVVGDEIVCLADLADGPDPVIALLAGGAEALAAARRRLEGGDAPRHGLGDVTLCSPIARPPKFLAIGLNYADHIAESGMTAPEVPVVFNKQSTCVTGPFDPIVKPQASDAVDYEGELAFVIGTRCRHVPAERAHEVIAGYLVTNDVSVRDWQLASPTMTMGKSWDTHGPLGPWLTIDPALDPHDLRIRTWVNGTLRQDASTSNLVHDCYAQVAHLSTAFTLEPGDVVATGTPAGVGFAFDPPRMLAAGDVVRVEIEELGAIENPVVDEPDADFHTGEGSRFARALDATPS